MDKNISATIVETCKKLGIPYKSCNSNYVEFYNDAKRLGEIYLELNSLTDELENILNRHKIDHNIKDRIEQELNQLHNLDHELIKLAYKIKKND
jgi:tRNA(Ile)-lysidine synthase TilS/MesJ